MVRRTELDQSDVHDVAVVGGGILGLAHAWMAARRGLRVILLERTAVAEGAWVRNFGMIWPIGQRAGEPYQLAIRARNFWLELHRGGVLQVQSCGSLQLAHHADEGAVLEEFDSQGTHPTQLWTTAQVLREAPLANAAGLLVGMYNPLELRVNPRTACAQIAKWLNRSMGIECVYPELDHYGIHVMASPLPSGEVILGDSHEYGNDISPFDKSEIDALMLRELQRVFALRDWTIQERWHGIYAKHPSQLVFEADVADHVKVFTGTGGAGMTLAFGLADQAWSRWGGF